MVRRTRRSVVVGGAIALAVLGAAAFVAVRYGLAAGPVRTAVESRLSASLGQPVTIGHLRLSLSPQFALTGTSVRVGAADVPVPSIGIERVVVVPRFRSLFSDTVIIDDVLLDGFTVALLRADDRRWSVPAVLPAPRAGPGGGVAIRRVRVTGGQVRVFVPLPNGVGLSSGISDVEADLVPGADGLRIAPLSGRIGSARITGEASVTAGAVRLQFTAPSIADADLGPLLALAASGRPAVVRLDEPAAVAVSMVIDRGTARLTGEGTLRAPAVTIGPFRIARLEAPFTMTGPKLSFDPTTFGISSGSHRGAIALDLAANPPRWSADGRLERLDTGALFDAVAGRDTHVDGVGRIEADMRGQLDEHFIQALAGRARLLIGDGVLRDFPLIAAVNRTLRLAEAESKDTRFERLSATLAIAGSAATTEDLAIDAAHLRVLAAGRIGFDGALDLRGRAIVSKERAAAAVASVRELARLRTGGEIVLPLTISGTLDQPRFGIDVKAAVGQGVRDELMRRLRRIIK